MSWLEYLPYLAAFYLLVIGAYGVVTSRNVLHMVNCVSVVHSSSFVLLLAVGYRRGARAPVLPNAAAEITAVDPVVQALALTSVVAGAVTSALLLAIAVEAQKAYGTLDPDEIRAMKG